MAYRIALIDVDDTLLDFGQSERQALRDAFAAYNLPFAEETADLYHEINDTLWKKLEKGQLSREQLWHDRYVELFERLGLGDVPAGLNEAYMQSLARQAFPMEGAEEMLRQASEMARLFIVTNGVAAVQRERLKKTGLGRFFENSFISQELGVQKPAKAFFDKVLEALGPVDRKEVVLLGDSLTSDMKGARTAGITACWFCPDETRPDVPGEYDIRISRLGQFISVLKGERA